MFWSVGLMPATSIASLMSETKVIVSAVDVAAAGDFAGALLEGAGDIARAAGNIDQRLAGLGVQPGDHVGFPDPVDAGRHQVVHQVVLAGDGREHAFDAAGFFIPADILEPEGNLVLVHDADRT